MCDWAQVIITEDVNLRSIATGEGIMAVPSPGELPKKRKEFLPKMFPSLPEDSAVSLPSAHLSRTNKPPPLSTISELSAQKSCLSGRTLSRAMDRRPSSVMLENAVKWAAGVGPKCPGMKVVEMSPVLHAQAARMAARRAKYAENPELDALKQGLSTAGRRKPAPYQPDEHRTPSARDAVDASRSATHLHQSWRVLVLLELPCHTGKPTQMSLRYSGSCCSDNKGSALHWCCAGLLRPYTALCGQQADQGRSPMA